MADDDVDSTQFLEDREPISADVDFQLASGVRWGDLAAAIVASVATAVTLGLQSLVGGFVDAVTNVLGGIETFITGGSSRGLIDVIGDAGISAVSGVWNFSLTDWGILASVMLTVTLFASLWALSQAADYIREEGLP